MLKIQPRLLITILVIGFVGHGMLTGQTGFAKTLKAAIIQVKPYCYITEDGQLSGLHYDLLTRLAEEVGFSLEADCAPFARVLKIIQEGDADLTLMYLNQSIEKSAVVVGPFSLVRNVVFGPPGSQYDSLEDLHCLVVGNIRRAHYDDAFTADEAIEKYWTNTYQQSLKMLIRNRIDAVVGPEHAILYTVRKMGLTPDIFGAPLVLNRKEGILFFSKKTADTQMVIDLRKGLKILREQGVIREIYASYLNSKGN